MLPGSPPGKLSGTLNVGRSGAVYVWVSGASRVDHGVQVGNYLSSSVSFSVNVIEALPTQRVVWASTVLGLTATRTFTFDGHSGTTIVTDRKTFESPLIPVRLVYPRPVIRLMTESWLNDLKAESERLAQRRSSLM